ncbi:MAG: hypothetical protein M3Z16_09930 [Pseudomonadota bacterium]|nr:hypothetical protein [Pseudomonadota bacterium]
MSHTITRLLSTQRRHPGAALAIASAAIAALAGCSSGASSDANTLTVQGDVPIAYAMRSAAMNQNPTNGGPTMDGGDLIIREKSSASALEHNMTAQFTQGKGDVQSPDVSFDGNKIIFAMRCPATNSPLCGTGNSWHLVEYDRTGKSLAGGTFRLITDSAGSADVEPSYLPGGKGFVFSSNRQTKSSINQALGKSYRAADEYEREGVFGLHTVDNNGGNLQQITFSQSHDRNPSVRPDGRIMFSHWDHFGGRNHFKIFTAKPDGTDLFVLYGAHSEGNSFLHPRDMDQSGKFKGFLTSDLMPLSKTHEGGGLMFIDAANFSEQNAPSNPGVTGSGQSQATLQALNIDGGLSRYGRVTTPYPLHDGTNRVLTSYAPCEVTKDSVRVSCAQLTPAEVETLGMQQLNEDIAKNPVKVNASPEYGVYMFDPTLQTFLIVAAPPSGFMYTHPVAIQPRPEPVQTEPTPVDATLAAQNMGILEVRSVYDTDNLGRMGEGMLTASDLAPGCTSAIATTAPTDPLDTRGQIADIAKLKDPASSAYKCGPAKVIRAVRAIPPGAGMLGTMEAMGNTEIEMRQILGYAQIEPDGSFKLKVPADTPISLCVVGADGACIQSHTNHINVRPGERRTCDGCHSPRRGGALNSGAVVNTQPAGLLSSMASAHSAGETMAGTRTRLDANAFTLGTDIVYSDLWADTAKPGIVARSAVSIKYTGNTKASDDLTTLVPVNGLINYPQHVAPLWTKNRGANTCVTCHNDPDKLDLGSTLNGIGRANSYDELTLGDPLIDPVTGMAITKIEEGEIVIARGPALTNTMTSEGDATGLARKSRLWEIMTGKALMSSADDKATHPNPPATAPDHSKMLNAAEKRLVAEWIDNGSQYYNDPFDPGANMRVVAALSRAEFEKSVKPILMKTCAAYCHQAIGSDDPKLPKAGTSFRNNRLVFTNSPDEGDFNVTLTMISNVCSPASNLLLKKPSTVPHPPGKVGQTAAVLPVGSADYNTIQRWIASGCS